MRRMIIRVSLFALFGALLACPPEPDPDPPPPPPAPTPPDIVAISPSSGVVDGGETVTLLGENLEDVTLVAFGTAPATVVSAAATELVVTSPAGERGSVDVSVTASDGNDTLEAAFTYQVPVVITQLSPASIGANASASISIQGSGFVLDGIAPTVRLGGTTLGPGDITSSTETRIDITVPALPEGTHAITVANADGREGSADLQVLAALVVAGISPSWGYMDRTTDVIISGSGLAGTQAVVFGTVDATSFTVEDDGLGGHRVRATAPASASAGNVDVTVRRGVGDEGTLPGGFRYVDPDSTALEILGLEPDIGRSAGGTQVDIWGTGFSGTTRLLFGGVEATVLQVFGGNHVQVQTPPHSVSGSVVSQPVDVQAEDGATATLTNGFTYYRVPVVSQVDPTTLPTAGGEPVTVQGEGFTVGTTQVLFGTAAATNVVVSDQSSLTCLSPAHPEAQGVPVKVITEFEESAEGPGVNFVEVTRIQAVEPDTISMSGGSLITVTGTGLADPTGLTVQIDGNPVDDLARPSQNVLTFRSRGPMPQGGKTLLVRNNESGQEHSTTIEVSDFTDPSHLHRGGPIAKNLNITVIRDDTMARLDGVVVFVGPTASVTDGYNKRITDSNGMTVLSGDLVLTGPLNVTVGKTGFETQTLVGLNAQYLTVLLSPKAPEAQTTDNGTIAGMVTGWANSQLPSGTPTNRYYRVAYVYPSDDDPNTTNFTTVSPEGPYAIEIRADHPATTCPLYLFDGTYSVQSDASYTVDSTPGTHAVLAVVYYWDSYDGICGNQPPFGSVECQNAGGSACEGWMPFMGATFGVTTDIQVQGGGGATGGVNIDLSVPADPFSVNITGNPTYAGSLTAYTADLYLDLGNSGTFTFLAEVKDNGSGINFGSVPRLLGSWTYTVRGYVAAPVLDGAAVVDFAAPVSTTFVRGWTSGSSPTISTWVYFPQNMSYTQPTGSEGRFSYTRSGGAAPDFTAITVYDAGADSFTPLWTVFAAGDPGTITLPDLAGEEGVRMDGIPTAGHFWDLYQVKVDNFDFDNHTREERTTLSWRAGVQSETQVLNHN